MSSRPCATSIKYPSPPSTRNLFPPCKLRELYQVLPSLPTRAYLHIILFLLPPASRPFAARSTCISCVLGMLLYCCCVQMFRLSPLLSTSRVSLHVAHVPPFRAMLGPFFFSYSVLLGSLILFQCLWLWLHYTYPSSSRTRQLLFPIFSLISRVLLSPISPCYNCDLRSFFGQFVFLQYMFAFISIYLFRAGSSSLAQTLRTALPVALENKPCRCSVYFFSHLHCFPAAFYNFILSSTAGHPGCPRALTAVTCK